MNIVVPQTKKSLSKYYSCKIILFTFLVSLISVNALHSQSVAVDDTSYSANSLVELLVANNCVTTSNYNLSSNKSVAYFNNNSSSFPIKEGIIIRNGIAKNSAGKFLDNKLSSKINDNSDDDLNEISNNSGQNSNVSDVAFLSFDFISQSSEFDFNFIFASNEYGEWQCGFSDVFGFILTDLSTGEKINLAVLPNSNDIISVKSIRDTKYNTSCNSVNASLFSTYNTIDANSNLNMRGHTVLLNASSKIETNKKYNLKLVIGDYGDSNFDSAVFIESGNFNKSFNIGDDFKMCENEPFTLDTKVANDANFSFDWYKDGQLIVGENKSTFNGSKIGKYNVIATNAEGCEIKDEIVISQIKFSKNPSNLYECDNGAATSFNVGQYDLAFFNLDKDRYELDYFNSVDNINANNPISPTNLRNYLSAGDETIYIKLKSKVLNELCEDLTISFTLNTVQFKTDKPTDIEICSSSTATINIPDLVNTEILQNLNFIDYNVTFYPTFKNAQDQENQISNATTYPIKSASTASIFARTESKFNDNCFDIVEFNLTIFELPEVDDLDDVIECENFVLPELTNGNYFTRTKGTGTPFFAGHILYDNQTIFIYNENENGCFAETSFIVSILDKFELKENYCEKFVVFNPPNGNFFTAPGGEAGGGDYIVAGTELTESQTIYYYATVNTEVCKDKSFDVVIIPRPAVDTLQNIATCTNYTLPTLTNGKYFTNSNGTGDEIVEGTEISTNKKIYIYNEDQKCGNQTSFEVFKINIDDFKDLKVCGSYTLPQLNVGGYYTLPNAQGEKIDEGTAITESQEIYYFVETNDTNNCTTDLSFKIDVFPIPKVDTLKDVVKCINEPYVLPVLTYGQYFTQSKGKGTQLNPGDIITNSSKIYIYNKNENCDKESSFNVEIRFLPKADVFTDVFACKPFVLPTLNNGNYFTQPDGKGEQLKAGDIISETTTIYIYSIDTKLEGCTNENIFTVEYIGVEVDKINNINSCDTYSLPPLNVGEYFTETNGQGTKMNSGDTITEDIELYIYAENGNRFFCSDEHLFSISISKTPTLQDFTDIEKCGSYTLQEISTVSENKFEFYRKPNKVDLIRPEDFTITDAGEYSIYAVESVIRNENCYTEKQFKLTIYPLLDLFIDDVIICQDFDSKESLQPIEIKTGLDPVKFSANWYFDGQLVGTGVNFNATNSGVFRVEPVRLLPEVGSDCNYKPTEVKVIPSSPKPKITYVTNAFDDKTTVRVDFVNFGLGNYIYKLDDGEFQTDNVFTAIETGIYTITIRDTKGFCPDLELKFTALNYPKYFTPNDDGTNDFWNIEDLKNYPEAIIQVYNRYGALITAFKATEQGWNGLQNGKKSPSNSYWFRVHFVFKEETTSFESYFSLERN